MAGMTKVGVGYNVQLAVDVKHKLIAEQVVSNQVLDMGLLAPTITAAMETLGVEQIEAVADRGYFKIEDLEACEAAGITPFVPKPIRGPAVREGFFSKEEFRYQADDDVFICPAGAVLLPRRFGKSRDNVKLDYSNKDACKGCALKPRCTRTFRHVSRLKNEAVLERMAARLAARPSVLDQRRESVEHPFGTIKQWMNQGAFLMRRLENVRGEFSLSALAYNIKRAITIIGVPGLIRAIRAGNTLVSRLPLSAKDQIKDQSLFKTENRPQQPVSDHKSRGTHQQRQSSTAHDFPHGLVDLCTTEMRAGA